RPRVAALPRAQFQPPPAQPPPSTQSPSAPSQPPGQPAPPGLMPPGPFVPQPGVPPQTLPPQKVVEVVVRGNEHVPTDQILAVVSTKPNDPLNDEKLRNDVQAILNLGEFADVVVRFEPHPDPVREGLEPDHHIRELPQVEDRLDVVAELLIAEGSVGLGGHAREARRG